ncbi:hypothetical protein A2W24_00165 [Microgenomates group bacterium RBG_16_45_19]|nr:MAG: hypothetical protein A2W24_00165 [Microgenomates group bacterium RBG_16_45_19]
MPVQTFTAKVSDHTLIKDKFQYVTFELIEPQTLNFQAGQYLMMNVPGMAAKKSYSIASNPAENYKVEILVDVSPQGDGSLYLQSLNPGETISFMAPIGRFVLAPDPTEPKLVFVATGSGISAVRSIILNLLHTQHDLRPLSLHWGLRYPQDIFWEQDFFLLHESFSNFTFDLVLSRPPENWPLCSGRVTDCLKKHYQSLANTGFYLCGNKPMIEDVSQYLLSQGVSETHIHHEQFY